MATSQSSTSSNTEAVYGYEAEFVDEPDKKYICPVCLAVMRHAMQTSCGHRFCEQCITKVARRHSPLCKCPVDNTIFNINDELFPDIAIRREILSLQVFCGQHNNGCEWIGDLRDLQEHGDLCSYIEVQCDYGCNSGNILRLDLSTHLEQCDLRPVRCEHCNSSETFVGITRHQLLDCVKFPVACSLCGKGGINREDIPSHLCKQTGDCPRSIIPCRFENYGCQFVGRREIMDTHQKESAHVHLNCLLQKIDQLENTVSSLTEQVSQFETSLNSQNQAIRQTTSYDGKLLWKIALEPRRGGKYVSQSFYTGCPGYKIRMSMQLHGLTESNVSYTSLFVIHDKGEFDDQLPFPLNANCHVRLLANDRADIVDTNIVCSNVPRCTRDSEMANCQRGLLRYMRTVDLLSGKFMIDRCLFLHVNVEVFNYAPISSIEAE